MKKSYEMDMCHGPLLGKILAFSIPLIISSNLQLLFNAADTIVVGRFAGPTALAAVGSTSSLIQLLLNLFIGLSIGCNVLVARYYGANETKNVHDTVHSSIAISIVGGILLIFIGIIGAGHFLTWMGTPDDVLPQAALYMRLYFIGMPFNLLYNFGSSILRAIGDTKRPLYYLIIAGIVNVALNLVFVIAFHMGVAGVAIATVVSQVISALLVIKCLIQTEGPCHLNIRDIRFDGAKTKLILRIGLPAGVQGMLFSIANVLIQSSVNSFGSIAMAGNTAAMNIESFVYMSMNAYLQTAMSFTSQNWGAGEQKRIHKVLGICLVLVVIVGVITGWGAYLCGRQLLHLYSTDEAVIAYGLRRMRIIATSYFLCGIMDTIVGALRGIGSSILPMIIALVGACGLRIVWIMTIFQVDHTLENLYISYPISWLITLAAQFICYVLLRRKQLREIQIQKAA